MAVALPIVEAPGWDAPDPELWETAPPCWHTAATAKVRDSILLVEDDERLRRTLGSLLRHFGYQVLEAANANEALQLWSERQDHIGLLVTDLVMPGNLNGLDLVKVLRERWPGLQVIVSSGSGPETVTGLCGVPQVTFLAKPFSVQTLADAIHLNLRCLAAAP